MASLQPLTPDGQTFSAGVAPWRPGLSGSQAVAAADTALYAGKRAGRGRVELAVDAAEDGPALPRARGGRHDEAVAGR